jgi:transposase
VLLIIEEEEYQMIQELAQEQEITTGKVNISALSKQTGYDRKTIRKYLTQCKSDAVQKSSETRENLIAV